MASIWETFEANGIWGFSAAVGGEFQEVFKKMKTFLKKGQWLLKCPCWGTGQGGVRVWRNRMKWGRGPWQEGGGHRQEEGGREGKESSSLLLSHPSGKGTAGPWQLISQVSGQWPARPGDTGQSRWSPSFQMLGDKANCLHSYWFFE